ncbi:hypothetical protein SAMN04488515_0502 [Cognatiyoonia koreensis]|uniref:Uncharacterized protein n=1 Tax=Cognatiyoonia koreensis TaxID=364200 RepID=A0A1I0NB28_9RHOB|nr:hypothetical protein [Cognatiyoonia koreensis]SEV98143.1 hypothetical protein SAMN04488515_0502 [Cognatiyoonia koreensis]
MRTVVLSLLIGLCACAEFPALDERIDDAARAAPYPTLTNIAPLIAQANASGTATNSVATEIDGRRANLSARADRLRGAIIEPALRNRMQRGVDTSALP